VTVRFAELAQVAVAVAVQVAGGVYVTMIVQLPLGT